MRERNAAMRRAASAVPGGEETIATIDALVAGSPAAAPELARARTIGERTAVARSVASTLPLGIEAFESFSLERELAARNAPFHLALGMGADPAELDSRSGNITPVSDRASGPGAPPTGGGSRPAQEATPPRRVPLTELPVWVQRSLVAQGVDIPGVPRASEPATRGRAGSTRCPYGHSRTSSTTRRGRGSSGIRIRGRADATRCPCKASTTSRGTGWCKRP